MSIPEVAKLEATLKAMQIASSFEWRNVCLKTDALTVNKAIIKRDRSCLHWALNFIFDDILSSITDFHNIFFVWALRNTNRLAYIVVEWMMKQRFSGLVDPLYLLLSFVLCVT